MVADPIFSGNINNFESSIYSFFSRNSSEFLKCQDAPFRVRFFGMITY